MQQKQQRRRGKKKKKKKGETRPQAHPLAKREKRGTSSVIFFGEKKKKGLFAGRKGEIKKPRKQGKDVLIIRKRK